MTPSKALRFARLLIALGLAIGVLVFAVLMIEELKAGVTTDAIPADFGAAYTSTPQQLAKPDSPNPLAGLTTTDPTKFIPILRDNPHPGEIMPFMKADPFGQPPYRQPTAGNDVWELCAYRVRDASLADLIAHYDQQARGRSMRLARQRPTTRAAGGIVAAWSDGQRTLEVTALPLPMTEPTTPPLAPPNPLQWVVKYSYPEAAPTR